jgi:hypothetical protein
MSKNLSNEIDQIVDLNFDHVRNSALSLSPVRPRHPATKPQAPAPDFTTGLTGTLSEKPRACLWPQSPSSSDCDDLPSRYAWSR